MQTIYCYLLAKFIVISQHPNKLPQDKYFCSCFISSLMVEDLLQFAISMELIVGSCRNTCMYTNSPVTILLSFRYIPGRKFAVNQSPHPENNVDEDFVKHCTSIDDPMVFSFITRR